MKRTAFAAIALTANIAVGATSITVDGYGADRESAKRDAFRTAIENVCGTTVLSDREHFNSRTTHNKVITYSACRVDNYTILEEGDGKITMRVNVTRNNISQRLLASENKFRTPPNIKSQLNTSKEENNTGDELIDSVFRDYPYRAYNVKSDPHIVKDPYRNTYLEVPFTITWNYNFIKSMIDTFATFDNKGPGVIKISAKNPDAFLIGHSDTFHIDDLYRLSHIKSKFVLQNEMRLRIKARDNTGRTVLNICYSPEYRAGGIFFSVGVRNNLTIFGNDRYTDTLRIKLTFPADVIYDTYVDVVPDRDCKL